MSLRRPPTRTAAFLAANRSNALKSTGPRTPAGKARVAMNSIRRGGRAFRLRQNLLASGARREAALYDWILDAICRCYEIPRLADGRPGYGTEEFGLRAEKLARAIFVGYQQALAAWRQAKPESPFDSRVFANVIRFQFRVRNPERTRELNFWLLPGRGPNYAPRSTRLTLRAGLPGPEPSPARNAAHDSLADRLRAHAGSPADPQDPLADTADVLERLGTLEHSRLWAGCRILPPTPRVTIHRWVEVARWARRPGRPRSPVQASLAGALGPSSLSSSYPGTLLSPSIEGPPGPGRPAAASPAPSLPRRAGGPVRTHALFPSAARPAEGVPARLPRFLSAVVRPLRNWVGKRFGLPSPTNDPRGRSRETNGQPDGEPRRSAAAP